MVYNSQDMTYNKEYVNYIYIYIYIIICGNKYKSWIRFVEVLLACLLGQETQHFCYMYCSTLTQTRRYSSTRQQSRQQVTKQESKQAQHKTTNSVQPAPSLKRQSKQVNTQESAAPILKSHKRKQCGPYFWAYFFLNSHFTVPWKGYPICTERRVYGSIRCCCKVGWGCLAHYAKVRWHIYAYIYIHIYTCLYM